MTTTRMNVGRFTRRAGIAGKHRTIKALYELSQYRVLEYIVWPDPSLRFEVWPGRRVRRQLPACTSPAAKAAIEQLRKEIPAFALQPAATKLNAKGASA